jgi:hypothetical protein
MKEKEMRRNCKTSIGLLGLVVALVVFLAGPAFSDPMAATFVCTWDGDNSEIDYELTDGEDGQQYTVTAEASGCVSLSETPPDLTGPTDSDNVTVACDAENSTGTITLTFWRGEDTANVLVASCICEFTSDGACALTGDCAPASIPTLTEWGFIIFTVLLLGWMAWMVVRRRQTVKVGI